MTDQMDGAVIRSVIQDTVLVERDDFENGTHELAFSFDSAPKPLFDVFLFDLHIMKYKVECIVII